MSPAGPIGRSSQFSTPLTQPSSEVDHDVAHGNDEHHGLDDGIVRAVAGLPDLGQVHGTACPVRRQPIKQNSSVEQYRSTQMKSPKYRAEKND